MWDVSISECTRKTTCYDCGNEKCWHHGQKESDCPKYRCDNKVLLDCDNCGFIDEFIEEMREFYKIERD